MRLLGGVEVLVGGAEVPVAGAKLKAILAMLALAAPHPVPHERIIDEIWADDPVANPANALQAQVSAVRRLLGREAVERRGQGYVLALGPDDVDTIRVERLVRAGREAAAAGAPGVAVEHHQAALALVRGPALADVVQYRFAREAAVWLDELVLGCREDLLDALLANGEHTAVAAKAVGLVQAHPLRERFHAQLVLALYRSGRQADALRSYQEARTVLLDELGIDPGPELRALEQAVLAQDPSLDLVAMPSGATPAVAPPDPIVVAGPPLVGRDMELAVLQADLDSARAGRGRIAAVGGEPGIGKTRLVEEISDDAAARGMSVVWGRCFDGRGAPAFWPWTQVVNHLLADFAPDELRSALGANAAVLAQIAPAVQELVPDHESAPPLDPGSAAFRLCRSVFDVIDRLSRVRPILVVVDDLHWADPSSLDVITFMASEMFDSRVLVLGTYRNLDPTLGGALAQALVELGRRSVVRRVDLVGLDLPSLDRLLEVSGAVVDDAVLARMHRRTGGNPFFVSELLRFLPTEEARVEASAAEAVAFGAVVPVGVKGVIRQRVARLPDTSQETLAVAATLGQDFDLAVLAATVEASGATLLDHLDPALEAGIVIDNPGTTSRYRFSHGLVNETIYDDLGGARRARTHLRIAEALEAHHGETSGPHLLEIATHWHRAVPAAAPTRGIDAAVRAAAWAQAHVAHKQAEAQLRAALDLVATMPHGRERSMHELALQDRLSLLLIAATSYTDPEFGRVCARVRKLSYEVDDHRLIVPALWRLSINQFMMSNIQAGFELSHELMALDRDDSASGGMAGAIVAALVTHQEGDQAAARVLFDRAIELCEPELPGDLTQLVAEDPPSFVRFFSSLNRWLVGDEMRAEQECEESFYLAARDGTDSWATMISQWSGSTLAMFRRDPESTLARCEYGLGLARAGGFGLGVPYMNVCKGWAMAYLGVVEGGAAQMLEGAAVADAFGAEYMRPAFAAIHAEICDMAGRHDEAFAAVERGFAAVEGTGERWYEAELHRMRGRALAVSAADRDSARAAFVHAAEVADRQGSVGFARRAEADLAALG